MTFYSLTTLIHLSGSHVCAETMTVRVACSARCRGGTSPSCSGTITATQRNKQGCSLGTRLPGCPTPSRRHPPPPPAAATTTPLFAKVRAQSAELFTSNCLAGSGCRCYCFFFLLALSFLSPLHLVGAGCQVVWHVRF